MRGGNWPRLQHFGFSERTSQANDGPIYRWWQRYIDSIADITFFPEIRYRGFRVYPQGWHYESSEPLLKCYMDHSEISAGGWDATKERMCALIEDGWQWDQREGGIKYVHVDDLEKIEGPPPAPGGGAF